MSMLLVAMLAMPLTAVAAGTGGGNCIDLGGQGEHVFVESLDALPSFTMEMWVKYTAESFAPFIALICFGDYHPCFGLWYGRPYLEYGATSTSYMERNVWTHLAVTYTGAPSYISTVYVNGKVWASANTQVYTTGEDMRIGFSTWESYNSFFGEIDDVRVWNTVLDQVTIQTWMNKQLDSSHPNIKQDNTNNLVGYWMFDEFSGTTAEDSSDDIAYSVEYDGVLTGTSGDEWITSTAPVGDASHFVMGAVNVTETADVPVDISWDDDAGDYAVFSVIQINDTPVVTTGLPETHGDRYWEVWIAGDDGDYQADVSFHYDDIPGITSEGDLSLFTRSFAGQGWSEVTNVTRNTEGNNTDGVGSITANDLIGFSQFILASTPVIPGDVDGNEEVNVADISKLVNMILGLETETPAGDVNGDGNVNVFDITKLIRLILKID